MTDHLSHTSTDTDKPDNNPAVELIRQKVAQLYADEPDARAELREAEQAGAHRSKHQQFMHRLSASGKSLSEIQTEWHAYYASLPDDEKHAVWQEFYAQSAEARQPAAASPADTTARQQPHAEPVSVPEPAHEPVPTAHQEEQTAAPLPAVPAASIYPTPTALDTPSGFRPPPARPAASFDFGAPATAHLQPAQAEPPQPAAPEPASAIPMPGPYEYQDSRQELLAKVQQRAKLKPRHHVQSLLFGLGCGGLALLLVLFSFFNELVVAPFIQPSRTVSATPIIIGADGVAPTDKAEVIIPKINVQIPLVFDVPTIKEADVQKGLERGVVHYPTTAMPGQKGNAAFFGHSSNNIFNPGQYKFAFVLLHELVPGDTFYLTRDGVAYAYQVIDKKIIEPTEIGILDPIPDKAATATLITCDPPGTTLRRLAVIGEQVNPDPNANTPAAPAGTVTNDRTDVELPGDAPSLWRRLTSW